MIHHISIPAQNPLRVATVLAEILQGKVFPFPPHPGSYITVPFDQYGTAVEVYPIGTELTPAPENAAFVQKSVLPVPTLTPFHAAISVPTSLEQLQQIGDREGWRVQLCDRGPFKVVECWLENCLLLEFLPPDLASGYLEFTQSENAVKFLAEPILAS
ncbi:MAG: hypothetical protein KME16_08385 [Scytolyngbya sp. HA4215-MV1]|jgi:hypothetical protein|nr:hypothetical protein [Scytolyngbya sp. HA4215-MV1]